MDRCKNFYSVSCLDCGTRFQGESFEKHIACVSEKEKYTGKKEKKKDAWAQCIQHAQGLLEGKAKSGLEQILSKISEDAVPMKKPKFVNLCKSSFAYLDSGTVNQIWEAIEKSKPVSQIQKPSIKEQEKTFPAPSDVSTKQETPNPKENQEIAENDFQDLTSKKKILKKVLKKSTDKSMEFDSAVELIGKKRVLKRLAKVFEGTFEIEKTITGSKRIKLVEK